MGNFIIHEGIPHEGAIPHSGRYPYGSGDDPYQRSVDFMGRVALLRKQGIGDTDIAKGMGMSTEQFRARLSSETARKKQGDAAMVRKLKAKGMSNTAIGERLGLSEGTVRNYLKEDSDRKAQSIANVKSILKENVDTRGFIDVGSQTERYLGVSREKMKAAIAELKAEGYKIYYSSVRQVGTGKETSLMALCPPDTEYGDFKKNMDQIKVITDRSEDNGATFRKIEPPVSVDSSRIKICYTEEGGGDKDGVIELRRGVEDLSLGNARYAQVRIAVDGTHYLKGMAMYRDDMPEGVDIIFNTSKHVGTPMMSSDPDGSQVLKSMKDDPENPFGATIRKDNELVLAQRHYIGSDGKEHLSALNIVNEEGNWGTWSRSLSSQFLSKQSTVIAKKQLDLEYSFKKEEFDEIMSLTNPTVKKKLLQEFADGCDSDAAHLKAAGLPRQGSYVILPTPDIAPNRVYAPNYRDGELVALVRYPHGGVFEIPELIVDNNSPGAKALKPVDGERSIRDAIGIHPDVAKSLSGADFDGDTVLVIPMSTAKLKTSKSEFGRSKAFESLKSFDPKEAYPYHEGMTVMKKSAKGQYMGDVSNLITDMTIKGASPDEIVRAVRHSMVVIDAPKHKLDFMSSYEDNRIAELKEKYQGGADRGASTLISKSKAPKYVKEQKEGEIYIDPETGKEKRRYIDLETGEKLYRTTGKMINAPIKDKKTGKIIGWKEKPAMTKTTQMGDTKDARTLSSGTRMEEIYAAHANQLKTLANQARKEYLKVPLLKYDPSANKVYKNEVASLLADLNIALKNAPLERQAQLLANSIIRAKKEANPDMDADTLKKIKGRALTEARERTGAGKTRIKLTPERWKVIESGAISNNRLMQILDNADSDVVKKLATPRTSTGLTASKLVLARSMSAQGYTVADIADRLGVSTSTIDKALN